MDNTNMQLVDGLQSRCLQQIEEFVSTQSLEAAGALLEGASIALRKYKEMLAVDCGSLSQEAYSIVALTPFSRQINQSRKKLEFLER